ncbi:DUF2752 domain-containing protein [Corallibacter vietnamensis]|uniref:DUF2752 domain-containing protein n=1 Tax=Corallibacter vietnamensis TaxID=904130 RepID=A0ABP7HEA8_9FLAO
MEEYMLPCLNKKIFGFDCLGCGLQRAAALLIRGEFVEAFYMYPAIYTLTPLFLVIGLNFFFKFKHASKIINTLAILTVAIIIVSFTIKIIN